ncbi:MAG: FAD-binding protein [Bacteroidetes bacterium GWF2_38_335]|nr:MAG: FAD-binding protein [Bacteroidetes bacterium GWF2_38_335]OFY81811.1 MAG: FAD-binding protein [Bacteroidetes bacterium RIFOXYA12_FULL_38_20]HBS87883.1 FAD-binding protein [Bacteroidales bacterium]
MSYKIDLIVTPIEASDEKKILSIVSRQLKTPEHRIAYIRTLRKSIDARSRLIKVNLSLEIFIDEKPQKRFQKQPEWQNVNGKTPVVVVGAGPAGLFAALRLIEFGIKPIVIERGKDVNSRKKDIALLNRNNGLNADSNYCFGEGGAGTFSDGKLYTRSKKRGDNESVFELFVLHGAPEEILFEAHPHIGSDKLPGIIKNIRETILKYGGEVHFNSRVDNLIIKDNIIKGVLTSTNERIEAAAVILATGHSAKDVYKMLHKREIALESKNFAMGVRVEHPQELIDHNQYNGLDRENFLPAATYSLVHQSRDRGVYSFCMCPGGFIVPAASGQGEMVVNGMSPSKRNSPFANAGIVVEIRQEDLNEFSSFGPLAGLMYQESIEKLAYINGGNGLIAPAQKISDFVKGKMSSELPPSSYNPGIIPSPMHFWLPENIAARLADGFKNFDNKIRGFVSDDAVMLGVESRTSSPVRIPRDRESFQHVTVKGLFPCGEGAGYAGGIVSSAVDGQRAAEMAGSYIK